MEHSDRVKLDEKHWSLAGSARIVTGPEPYLEMRYCCTRWSEATARVDTPVEVDYYRNGGILHTVLRRLATS